MACLGDMDCADIGTGAGWQDISGYQLNKLNLELNTSPKKERRKMRPRKGIRGVRRKMSMSGFATIRYSDDRFEAGDSGSNKHRHDHHGPDMAPSSIIDVVCDLSILNASSRPPCGHYDSVAFNGPRRIRCTKSSS